MKPCTSLIGTLGLALICLWCCSISGWAQPSDPQQAPDPQQAQFPPDAQGPPGMRPPDAPMEPGSSEDVRAPENASAQASTDVGEIRINWNKLGLSSEQKAQMVRQRRAFQVDTAGLREELKFAEADLRAEMNKIPADRAKIEALLKSMAVLKQRLGDAAIQNLLAIKSVLTPEQLQKLADSQSPLPPEFQTLKLTTEQRANIQGVLQRAMREHKEHTNALFELKGELQRLLLSPQPADTAKITELQTKTNEHEFALEKGRVELFLTIRDMLTPEQIERYQRIRKSNLLESQQERTNKK